MKIEREYRLPILTIEGYKDSAALLRLLINDYIKGSGTAHHTQLHKTFTHKKKTSGKRNSRQQKNAKYTSIKQRKAILALSCLIIYILFHPLKKHKANRRF